MSITKIVSPFPKNMTSTMKHYFQKFQISNVYIPEIKIIRNSFVNNQGLVLKNGVLVKGCAFNLLGKEDNTFYVSYWKLALEQMLVCRFGKSLKSKKLDDETYYLLIHSKWFNYSFWINSFLIRLILAENNIKDKNVKLIYPSEWDNISYVTQSLTCFNFEIERIPSDHHLFVKNLIMPETREWTNSFYSPHIKLVKQKILPFALQKASLKRFPKHIYLTRNKRNTRCVENEDELLPILNKFDFEIINFEDFTFWDQVVLMYHAKIFISIHGAGFSNILFMEENCAVMELINMSYADLEYKFPFWKLANACDLNYFAQFGVVNSNASHSLRRGAKHDTENKYLADENIYIDLELFEENINLMLAAVL